MLNGMRIVVIGNGMVGSRFCAGLAGSGAKITVLGAEPYAAYNRLQLSEVIAGRAELGSLELPGPPPEATVLRGVAATAIDRVRRRVRDSAGTEHPYDLCVLATGARARLPLPGDPSEPPPGVRTLRDLDDCRELLAAAATHDDITVLGGGLLGVELACGLRTHGVNVTLINNGPYPLQRQLPEGAGRIAEATLTDLGVRVINNAEVRGWGHRGTRLTVLTLATAAGPTRVPTSLLVVTAGVSARTELARAAGLPIRRGVVVGEDLLSPADPAIAAIGDCAETPDEGCPGLLAPGWAQADRLASRLRGEARRPPEAAGEVIALKAVGLQVTALGELDWATTEAGGTRVLELSDAAARRAVRIAVRDDRLVGAVCVGAPRTAADLTVAFERRTALPPDPAELLLAGDGRRTDPTDLPAAATVCRCNGVNRAEIDRAHDCGARTVEEVACATRAGTGCGSCTGLVAALLQAAADRVTGDRDGSEGLVAGPKHSAPLAETSAT